MQTILRSPTTEVKIKTDGPFIMIGEKINPTGRKKLAEALQQRNFDYVRDLALKQVEFGADVLDVNVGVPGIDDVALIPDVIKVIIETVKVPLCIDSPNPKVLEAALKVAPGKVLVNSTNGEEKTLSAVLPLVKAYGAAVIGLTMDDNGIPAEPEARLKIAAKIIERAAQTGHPDRGRGNRSAGDDGRRRSKRGRDHAEDHRVGAGRIRRQHQPRREQRVIRPARPAHAEPGVSSVSDGRRCDLCHHRPDQTRRDDLRHRFNSWARSIRQSLYQILPCASS